MKKIIHVNRHKIASNRRHGICEPPITVKTYKSNTYAREVEIEGPCKIVYTPDKPLKCGATLYIVTESDVKVLS